MAEIFEMWVKGATTGAESVFNFFGNSFGLYTTFGNEYLDAAAWGYLIMWILWGASIIGAIFTTSMKNTKADKAILYATTAIAMHAIGGTFLVLALMNGFFWPHIACGIYAFRAQDEDGATQWFSILIFADLMGYMCLIVPGLGDIYGVVNFRNWGLALSGVPWSELLRDSFFNPYWQDIFDFVGETLVSSVS